MCPRERQTAINAHFRAKLHSLMRVKSQSLAFHVVNHTWILRFAQNDKIHCIAAACR